MRVFKLAGLWFGTRTTASNRCSLSCKPRTGLNLGVPRLGVPRLLQNVLNEPRCSYCGPEAVDGWIGEMSAYLKVGQQLLVLQT